MHAYLFWQLFLLAVCRSGRGSSSGPRQIVVKVNLLIPADYQAQGDVDFESINEVLTVITEATQVAINENQFMKKHGYTFIFEIAAPGVNELLPAMTMSRCSQSFREIVSFIDRVKEGNLEETYIVMLPCSPLNYYNIFESMNLNVQTYKTESNTTCSRYSGVFYSKDLSYLRVAFANALLNSLGMPLHKEVSSIETTLGDNGVSLNLNFSDEIAKDIVERQCFKKLARFMA